MGEISIQNPEAPKPAVNASSMRETHGRWTGYWRLLKVRMIEFKREPEVVFWVFIFPILLALGLGIAFRNRPADSSRVAIVSGPGAEKVLKVLQDPTAKTKIQPVVLAAADAANGFRFGKYDLAVTPNADGSIQFQYDPARPESVLARSNVNDQLQTAAGRANPVATSSVAVSEPGSRYIDFLIPGLLGMNLMNSGMWGVGFALVEMRQRKLLKRFIATPMRRGDFLLALSSSRLVLMIIELGLLLGFGTLVFQLHVMGSWISVFVISAVGALSFAGVGLLTASRAQKIETVSGLINFVMLPMWIFSGVFFSYERFPAVVQPVIRLLPLTALNDALRATILQGSSLASQQARLLVLCAWGGISFVLALRWFRWT